MAQKVVMAWSKCQIEIGETGEGGVMATALTNVGLVKDRSASLEASEGDTLEAIASGGERVAREGLEGNFTLTARIIEPTDEFLKLIGVARDSTDEILVDTHLIDGLWSVKVTPKNVGARGIKAPATNITFRPGWSEEEGYYADLDFEILHGEADYWYSHFKSPGFATATTTE